ECVEQVRGREPSPMLAQLRPMLAAIDFETIASAELRAMMGMVGIKPSVSTKADATVNELLDMLPPKARERC
ncbi:MAG: hypothetical protein HC927_06375, partial [Deltaproteobacteria bacterium]|nr:hypothetical protein [Deltaproteobacteria bacterium]